MFRKKEQQLSSGERQILALLYDVQDMGFDAIRRPFPQVSPGDIQACLDSLEDNGLVVRHEVDPFPITWEITPEGRARHRGQ